MTIDHYHHGDLKNALIEAGLEILSKEGVSGLSLRKVARKAGVSHSAPYAHFADKQALIAAISTEGYRLLYEKMQEIQKNFIDDPSRQLVEVAWAYVRFAQTDPEQFKVTFSNAVASERDYPALVEMTGKCFNQVVRIVKACQEAGILAPSAPDTMAVGIWSVVHGFASLLIEGQISHLVLERTSVRILLIFALNQITITELPRNFLDPIIEE
jgi:AcrR family transcriptional regulator